MTDQLYSTISDKTLLRIKLIEKANEFNLEQVSRGIISIHARWSGQSIMFGRSILNLIDTCESTDFEINIIDIDTISPEKQIELMGHVCNGFFESVWVENGKIVLNSRNSKGIVELRKFKDNLSEKINKS